MFKKTTLLGLALLVLVATFQVWGGGSSSSGSSTAPTFRNLGGINVKVGTWQTNYNVNTVVARTENDQRRLEWRTRIQEEHNFTMEESIIASYGDMNMLAATSIMAGDPAANVFLLMPDWAMSLVRQGLAYPVTDNTSTDLRNPQPVRAGMMAPQWNRATVDAFTINGKGYAFSEGISMTTALVVFFNKRHYIEAGLDPELPYNMQRDGTWTWDNFLNLCRRLTRDINNDGIIDYYAIPQDNTQNVLDAVTSSNGATYVNRDPSTGRFYNASTRPEFLEALQFIMRLRTEGVTKTRPAGAEWTWILNDFPDGNLAMVIGESYIWSDFANMQDDWGVVMFPKGPRAANYTVFSRQNAMVVPSTFTADQVNNIMYAMALWHTPLTDDWKSGYYNTFRDMRAIDETLVIMRNLDLHLNKIYLFIPGVRIQDISLRMWNENDPAQIIESVSPNWNTLINEVNADLFR